mmetsp:Transcript_13020/g.20692  ORF Transcript_13020/g.20692 Transcript_13020/m.20692 type:complete len:350 (-) Transcript_13020:6-1055(-)|eukprot:CAMPEP_0197051884 /NCGR_PEP_ID=MMETSP1384-20130603/26440_1 /TAXON_ID=29189 /ORGANISM="Ammonia sp." /LENGTH=349 /DNA_ID=CAMNT_0042484505 /DNA_START=83 /DNA_END=1132 /DNA_ORIENTATION=+
MAQKSAAIEEGKKFMKQGHKLAKGGMFSKSNPDDAEKEYEKARKKFRFIKPASVESVGLHLEALEALATVREAMNLNNSAASAMEEAARTCQNAVDNKMPQFAAKMAKYLQRGAYFYRLNGQFDLASKLLVRAANSVQDLNEGIKLLDEACCIQEEENRFKTCHEFYDGAVKLLLENRRYKDAMQFIDRQNKMYGKDAELYAKRLWRNVLSKMIIMFHLKDVKQAQQMYLQGVQEYGNVSKCDEHELCEQFLSVFENADAEALANMQKNAQLGIFLINSVARIATKLDMKDIKPTVVIAEPQNDNDEQKEAEKEKHIQEAQKDVTDEQLKSEAANVKLDDDGAPNLIDM